MVAVIGTKGLITYVYIDGFNFYHGVMENKGPGWKWLDFKKWLDKLLPANQIRKIKHFTSKTLPKGDPQKPERQNTYFQALDTLSPIYERKLGEFSIRSEEKQTDVNLATHLVHDASQGKFEVAIVISNDSDFREAVRIVTQELKLRVGIINPQIGCATDKRLLEFATFEVDIMAELILDSQFPESVPLSSGMIIQKPEKW